MPEDLNSVYSSRHLSRQGTEINKGGPDEQPTFVSMVSLPNICYS